MSAPSYPEAILISERTIGRLAQYRRILTELVRDNLETVHSHQLALRCGGSAAQVRRDLMVIGAEGSPNKGYKCAKLLASLAEFLTQPGTQKVALVGIGNLGRALLSYSHKQQPGLLIVAAFDIAPDKTNKVIDGCRCFHIDTLESVIKEQNIKVAIIAVPGEAAQLVADRLAIAGVRGIVNFAPAPLHLPPSVFVENIDVTMSLEKVVYFAAKGTQSERNKSA